MVLTAVGTVLAVRLWIPLLGLGAPIAAAFLGSSWITLSWSSRVMPNVPAAILAVAVVGAAAAWLQGGRRRDLLLAAILLAAMALVRPTEAVVVGIAIAGYVAIARRSVWRGLLVLAIGGALGVLPWLVEMSVRFGGVREALREAATGEHLDPGPIGESLVTYLSNAGGKTSTSLAGGALWWSAIAALALAGILLRREPGLRLAASLAGIAALLLAAEYVILVPVQVPRFLVPGHALASAAAAAGVAGLLGAGRVRRAAGILALALFVPWAVWQGAILASSGPRVGSDMPQRVGGRIRELAAGEPCFVLTPRAYPQVAYAARCRGDRSAGPPDQATLDRLRRGGTHVFVILLRRVERPESPLVGLVPERFDRVDRGDWFLYDVG
jgi:hypothetical protein